MCFINYINNYLWISFLRLHALSQVLDLTNLLMTQLVHGRKARYLSPGGLTGRIASFVWARKKRINLLQDGWCWYWSTWGVDREIFINSRSNLRSQDTSTAALARRRYSLARRETIHRLEDQVIRLLGPRKMQ